jgi:hypothetical protein
VPVGSAATYQLKALGVACSSQVRSLAMMSRLDPSECWPRDAGRGLCLSP